MPVPPVPSRLPELDGLRRPRLRTTVPVLWRDATTISLGDRVVVDRVSRAAVAWLASLDGGRQTHEVAEDLPVDVELARRLLRAADAATALEDAAVVPDAIRWAAPGDRPEAWARFGAAVDCAGSVAGGLATVAAGHEIAVAVVGEGRLADAVRQAVALAGLRLSAGRPATITVLADLPHPDLLPGGSEPDGPHLPVSTWGRRAVAGPVVVPGTSACLRCAQLHRRDADPAWPLLGVQWSQAISAMPYPPVDPLLATLVGFHAVQAVRHWAADPSIVASSRAVEITLPDGATRWVSRPPHPLCGCRWTPADQSL